MSLPFRFVCATRGTQGEFLAVTALGRSLALYAGQVNLQLRLFAANSAGLPVVYNQALREAAGDPAILLFAHDDISLPDFFWPSRITERLHHADVLGIAGCRRRVPNQPSWSFEDTRFVASAPEQRSGVVGHGGPFPDCRLSFYGAPNQEVKLLDGALLIARSETLQSKGIWFDEAFDFHFYDLDFCRQAERCGLTMATCDIAVVHQSTGQLNSPRWREGYARYLAKWGS